MELKVENLKFKSGMTLNASEISTLFSAIEQSNITITKNIT